MSSSPKGPVGERRKRGKRLWGRLLRGTLLAVAVAFAVGFGAGQWLRCTLEAPHRYLAGGDAPPAAGVPRGSESMPMGRPKRLSSK